MPRLFNRARQTPLRQHLRTEGTHAEAVLWSHLKNRQAGGLRFRRQFGVGPYVLDFYCPEIRLAVEVDGSGHADAWQAEYDAERTRHLATVGIRVVRFDNQSVTDAPEAVVAAIVVHAAT